MPHGRRVGLGRTQDFHLAAVEDRRDVLIEILVIIALSVPLGFLAGTAMAEFSTGPYRHVRRVASLMLAVLRDLAGRPALSSFHASAPIHGTDRRPGTSRMWCVATATAILPWSTITVGAPGRPVHAVEQKHGPSHLASGRWSE